MPPAIWAIDGATGRVLDRQEAIALFTVMAVNPATNRVYAGMTWGREQGVLVFDAATAEPLARVPVEMDFGTGADDIAVNPVTNRVYVAVSGFFTGTPGGVPVLDGTTNAVVDIIAPFESDRFGPLGIAVNPTTNRIYLPRNDADSVAVLDGATHALLATVPVGGAPWGVAVNPSTDRVYVANARDNTLSVIDGRTNTTVATVPVGPSPMRVAVDPVTNRVYVAGGAGDNWQLTIVDGATHAVVATLPLGGRTYQLAVNPSSHRIYAAIRGMPALQVFEDPAGAGAR